MIDYKSPNLPLFFCLIQISICNSLIAVSLEEFEISPIVIGSDATNSSTLGIDYAFSGDFFNYDLSSNDSGDGSIDTDATVGELKATFSLSGTITENADENPRNFLESRVAFAYLHSLSEFSIKSGGFLEIESDQLFDQRNLVYGATGTIARADFLANNDIFALHLNIGQVDPNGDEQRVQILGEDLDEYYRFDFEVLYIFNIGGPYFDAFEVNYRYFHEFDADERVSNEGLDDFSLLTFRLSFQRYLYVAYSVGELPFNEKDNQIYVIGFSYEFGKN